MQIPILFILFFSIFQVGNVNGQGNEILEKVDAYYTAQRENSPIENVFIQTNKDYFNRGEVIWMNGFITRRDLPNMENKNFYVEILNKEGTVLLKKLIKIQNGTFAGDFLIPNSFSNDVYIIRGYTLWMFNHGPEHLFYKPIWVGNILPTSTIGNLKKINTESVSVKYTFQGKGNLVKGSINKIAVSVQDSTGLAIPSHIFIQTPNKEKYSDEKFLANGVGTISFFPNNDSHYELVVKPENGGTPRIFSLGTSQNGDLIHSQVINNNLFFEANYSDDRLVKNGGYLIGLSNQNLVFSSVISPNGKFHKGKIDLNEIPAGILSLLLIDKESGNIITECRKFIQQEESESLEINIERGKNKHQVSVSLIDTFTTVFGTMVKEPSDQNNPQAPQIKDYLLAYSELKFPFALGWNGITEDELEAALVFDVWRKSEWNKVLLGINDTQRFPMENGITIKGSTVPPKPKKEAKASITFVVSNLSFMDIYGTDVSSNGYFEINGAEFYDTAALYYRTNFQDYRFDEQAKFNIGWEEKRSFYPLPSKAIADANRYYNYLVSLLPARNNNPQIETENLTIDNVRYKTLEEVYVTSNRKTPKETFIEERIGPMFSNEISTIDISFLDGPPLGAITIETILRQHVPGLTFQIVNGVTTPIWRMGVPGLFIDEMVINHSFLSTISVFDIAFIRVIRPPFNPGFGSGGGSGAILIYTRRGNDPRSVNTAGMVKRQFYGYAYPKKFLQPNPSQMRNAKTISDNRKTLLWEPGNFLTNKSSAKNFDFVQLTSSENIQIEVFGIDFTGKIIQQTQQVKNN